MSVGSAIAIFFTGAMMLVTYLWSRRMLVTYLWSRRWMKHLDRAERNAMLRESVGRLTMIEWKPGMVLWVQFDPDHYEPATVNAIGEELMQFFMSMGIKDPPILTTASDVDVQAINIVDLLALVGKTAGDDE